MIQLYRKNETSLLRFDTMEPLRGPRHTAHRLRLASRELVGRSSLTRRSDTSMLARLPAVGARVDALRVVSTFSSVPHPTPSVANTAPRSSGFASVVPLKISEMRFSMPSPSHPAHLRRWRRLCGRWSLCHLDSVSSASAAQ